MKKYVIFLSASCFALGHDKFAEIETQEQYSIHVAWNYSHCKMSLFSDLEIMVMECLWYITCPILTWSIDGATKRCGRAIVMVIVRVTDGHFLHRVQPRLTQVSFTFILIQEVNSGALYIITWHLGKN